MTITSSTRLPGDAALALVVAGLLRRTFTAIVLESTDDGTRLLSIIDRGGEQTLLEPIPITRAHDAKEDTPKVDGVPLGGGFWRVERPANFGRLASTRRRENAARWVLEAHSHDLPASAMVGSR